MNERLYNITKYLEKCSQIVKNKLLTDMYM